MASSKVPSSKEFPLKKGESEWKNELSPEEYNVIREKGTELPGQGEYDKFYPKEGYFVCRACSQPLYSAVSKFKSGCGWPSFDKFYKGSLVTEGDDSIPGRHRTEIMCGNCGGHLGHVFAGEHMTVTNERHCVNSISVKYVEGKPPGDMVEDNVFS